MRFEPQTNDHNIFYRCVEDSYDAILVTDTKGFILYVNPAFSQMYGYSQAEALGQTPRLIRSGLQDRLFYSTIWQEILDPKKGFWKGELINRAKDGTEVPVLLTITPFGDHESQIQGYFSVALDMREKKQLEAQLLHQDRLASIGLLASGMAHEIGTPLGVIRGRAEYLMFSADPTERKSLDIIVSQIDRISKLIYSLLNLSRVSKSETMVSVSILEVVNEVLNLAAQNLKRNSIQFIADISKDTKALAEVDRLEQVLLNLVMNSIHAIESAIKEGRKEQHQIEVLVQSLGNYWEVKVWDTGIGITSENMKLLFKPFFTTKDVGSGTGLGLVICQQIVHSWGGKISAESEVGRGTTFRIVLPKAEP